METTVITPQEVKDWCRIDGDADDTAIALLIVTALELAQSYTGRVFTAENCPASIKQAIAVFAADLYRNREGQTVGEKTFYRLLNPYRVGDL